MRRLHVGLQDVDQPLPLVGGDLSLEVDRVAQAEQRARVAQGLDPARPNDRDEKVDAVATDIDGAAYRDGGGRRELARSDAGGQGRTVIQRPSQAGALCCTFSVNLFLSSEYSTHSLGPGSNDLPPIVPYGQSGPIACTDETV